MNALTRLLVFTTLWLAAVTASAQALRATP